MKLIEGVDYKKVKHLTYSYEIIKKYEHQMPVYSRTFFNDYLSLTIDGKLLIGTGYMWDGASGPAIDCSLNMRGSLVHDALYQLIKENCLPLSFRRHADKIFYNILREDGMSWIRAKVYYRAVRMFGGKFVKA
tara:strand:+ start:4059 stop:4457 length:399 start_codon:yes stop_codon:yes gene_type:complete